MDFYLIRHADAQAVGEGDITDDAERPLTEAGRAQCRPLVEALVRRGVGLDYVVASPLLRAKQTAEGMLAHWPAPTPTLQLCDDLAPGGKPRKATRFLRNLGGTGVAVVGHMPDLAVYAAWLIGSKKAQIEIAKSGVARIRFESRPGKGQGGLAWLLTPEWYPEA
jgi:phosphohistidine phosphatase